MITPREMLRDYMTVLNILMQNENVTFDEIVGSGAVSLKHESDTDEVSPNTENENSSDALTSSASFDPNDIVF